MLNKTQLTQKIGKSVLFIGTEACTWTLADLVQAARNARAMGIDTICPKRADGLYKWYGTAKHLQAERQAVLSEGVGYLPFTYMYGPRFNSVQAECDILKEIMDVCDGLVCADMEVEWNDQVEAAKQMAQYMAGHQGDIIVSTWADPYAQKWIGVIQALAPIVSAWGPQEYDNWLALQEHEFVAAIGVTTIFPAFDLSTEFSTINDPVALAAQAHMRGESSIWLWEYQMALSRMNLVKAIVAARFTPSPVVSASSPVLHSTAKWGTHVVEPGETLISIASALHITNWFHELYLPNRFKIEKEAQAHGLQNSGQGASIYPGLVLVYPIV